MLGADRLPASSILSRWVQKQSARISQCNRMQTECSICDSTGWVCVDHPFLPWGGTSPRQDACNCGGAGAPCLACNPSDREHQSRLPEGYRSFFKPSTEQWLAVSPCWDRSSRSLDV